MGEQAPAGWYPDGYGNERYWDGSSWTEQLRQPAGTEPAGASGPSPQKDGAFSRIGAAVKKAAADKRAEKEEHTRKQAEMAAAAGALVTSGVFGSSTIEIYAGGYVRVASWPTTTGASSPALVTKQTPFEKLRSINFTGPAEDKSSGSNSALEGAVGPAVASLIKGGKGLMKASAPGLAVAGIAHIAGAEGRKAFLTIVTDRQIHALTNQTSKGPIPLTKRGHNDVGLALEAAGNSVLGVIPPEAAPQSPVALPAAAASDSVKAEPTLAERMRELADLHRDGILSDEEFAAAKAKVLDSL
jgi:hypothetical protein